MHCKHWREMGLTLVTYRLPPNISLQPTPPSAARLSSVPLGGSAVSTQRLALFAVSQVLGKEQNKMQTCITEDLIEQFKRTWRTLREIVEKTPEAEWKAGSDNYLIPARLTYHILFTADLYATPMSYEEYKPHRTYKLNWETAKPEELPSREMMMVYIGNTEKKVNGWIQELGSEGLLKEQDDYDWTGKTPLGRALYILRHNQNHIGEINAELRRRGLEGGKW